ncbi:MAG: hypothetical protein AB7T19_02120 [Planctomycetota bacterium]
MSDGRLLTRRELLARGALCIPAIPALAPLAGSSQRFVLAPKTQRVVVVAFAGGVRKKDVLDTANAPNLRRIAAAGVTMPSVRVENLGHYGAALSIFTGRYDAMGIRENERGIMPTMFERLRKSRGFSASDVWLSTASGAQGRLFAASQHPDYGDAHAANVLDGDGIFNTELKKVLDDLGGIKAETDAERALVAELGQAIDPAALTLPAGVARPDPEQVAKVAQFVVDQLAGRNAQLGGPGAGDAKAIRTATDLLRVFRPKVLGVTLQNHDIAHGSYNGYVEVIRRNDQELGRLWDAIVADPELRDSTALFVLPEFGRDKDLNERNGLDHGDGSKELLEVFLVAAGPDFKKNKVIGDTIQSIDVCPTVLSMFGCKDTAGIAGSPIRSLFS